MTRPRSELIDRENGGYYHLGSRCVRRAMLCGHDPVTGMDYSHRRRWIEELLLALADVFTVGVCEYVVMSNHYHIIVTYQPQERLEFTDEEVARRWLTVYPPKHAEDLEETVAGLVSDPERLAVLRDRLGDLSWYTRRLNETIARRANQEDGCTGRFWQGRYKSKDLPSERSVLACMAYDALNPVRAGMADRVDAPEYTGLQRRLEEAEEEPERLDEPITPLVLRSGRVVSSCPGTGGCGLRGRGTRDGKVSHPAPQWSKICVSEPSSGRPGVDSSPGPPFDGVVEYGAHGRGTGMGRRQSEAMSVPGRRQPGRRRTRRIRLWTNTAEST